MRLDAPPEPVDGVVETGDMEKQALAGRYALGERVGIGGMADVFTARDTRLERDVAVKLFRPGTADGLERGSAEARMLARLDHPGLVRVLDMDTGEDAGDGAYLVMELVRGPDLGVRLRTSGSLDRESVRSLALDLARTLQYIHGQGIVHRDLKPSNILTRDVDPDSGHFRYLLTDFGIARFFDGGRMTATGQVIGSAAYFSPEQARGDCVGMPSDIYSLGLVLIEALTGERAFPGTGIESALARLHRSPSIPHAAGPALSALLVSMTLDGPGDRPDAAGVVRALNLMGRQAGPGGSGSASGRTDDPGTEALMVPGTVPPRTEGSPDSATASSTAGTQDLPVHPAAPSGPSGMPSASPLDRAGAPTAPTAREEAFDTARFAPGVASTAVAGRADPGSSDPVAATRDPRPPSRPVRRRSALPWILGLLAVAALVAAGLWFAMMTMNDSAPEIQPLPAVSGEPGERLQELYESVQP
jgi:serine/threonine protein kinase